MKAVKNMNTNAADVSVGAVIYNNKIIPKMANVS